MNQKLPRKRLKSAPSSDSLRDTINSQLNLQQIAKAHASFKRPMTPGYSNLTQKNKTDISDQEIKTNFIKNHLRKAEVKNNLVIIEEKQKRPHIRRASLPKTGLVPSTLLRHNIEETKVARSYTPIPIGKPTMIQKKPESPKGDFKVLKRPESPREEAKVDFKSPAKVPPHTKATINPKIHKEIQLHKEISIKLIKDIPNETSTKPVIKEKPSETQMSQLTSGKAIITKVLKPEINAKLIHKQVIHSINEIKNKGNIEDYIIGKQVGQGAYASVKFATHVATNIKVAFKTYEKIKLLDSNKKKNVIREIEILEMLNHKNIVKFIETIETNRQLHIVMEYISGCSLHGYLKRKSNRRLDEQEAKRLILQIVSALEYCHNKHIAHRDIKLENLLLDEKGDIKIIDFGFSTCMKIDVKTKIFCGTPSYMAPEIVSRKEYLGAPVDIWALGVIIFVFLTGTFPFRGMNDHELYRKIQTNSYTVPQYVSRGASSLISRILKNDPNLRPSAGEILKDP